MGEPTMSIYANVDSSGLPVDGDGDKPQRSAEWERDFGRAAAKVCGDEVEHLTNNLSAAWTKVCTLTADLAEAHRDCDAKDAVLAEWRASHAQLTEANRKQAAEIAELKTRLAAAGQGESYDALVKERDELRTRAQNAEATASGAANALRVCQEQRDDWKAKARSWCDECGSLRAQLKTAEAEVDTSDGEFQRLRAAQGHADGC